MFHNHLKKYQIWKKKNQKHQMAWRHVYSNGRTSKVPEMGDSQQSSDTLEMSRNV